MTQDPAEAADAAGKHPLLTWCARVSYRYSVPIHSRDVYRSAHHHHPVQLMFNCGTPLVGRPSMGAWITCGLRSESQCLPSFVVLRSGGSSPGAGSGIGEANSCLPYMKEYRLGVRANPYCIFIFPILLGLIRNCRGPLSTGCVSLTR